MPISHPRLDVLVDRLDVLVGVSGGDLTFSSACEAIEEVRKPGIGGLQIDPHAVPLPF